jgi:hypothetical protein
MSRCTDVDVVVLTAVFQKYNEKLQLAAARGTPLVIVRFEVLPTSCTTSDLILLCPCGLAAE